ncbi:MAG: cupredoxin domain-containing protein [Acidobacteriota bacterium]|nr:cupredoxin domain-containing protein [Acidobacteriota bacterium]
MDGMDFTIIGIAVALIVLVNWYFLGRSPAPVVAVAQPGAVAEFTIRVEGGYSPNAIEVARGSRVRLTFDRQEDNPCSEEVVVPDFGIRRDLPAFARTVVEFTADTAGTHQFACGMGMLRGQIIVK